MPQEKPLSLTEAGNRIAERGISNRVIQADEQITKHRNTRGADPGPDEDLEDEPEEHDDDPDDDAEEPNSDERDSDPADEETDDRDDAEEKTARPNLDAEFTIKVNGETTKVPLRELIQGYQRTEDYHRKTQDLATHRRDLQTAHSKVADQLGQKFSLADGIVQTVRQLLVGDVNLADMQRLRMENPQAWLVQRQAMTDRVEQVDGILTRIKSEIERHHSDTAQQRNANLAALVDQELETVRRHIPGWDKDGKGRLVKYLTDSGFVQDELNQIYDSRMLRIAEKARLYDAFQAEKKQSMQKKAAKPPKTVAANGGQLQKKASPTVQKQRDFRSRQKVAKQTGNMRDAGRAIAALLD